MSTDKETRSEQEEIEMLLPWYVTGKLDPADRARVEAYLSRHPAMRSQLDLIRDEQDQTFYANEAISPPSQRAVARLLAEVQRSPVVRARNAWDRLTSRLQQFFEAPSPGAVRWAAATAAVLVLVQTVATGTLITTRDQAGYQTASGSPTVSAEGTVALVRFADTATAKAIADTLAELDMTVVDGPKGGLFRVRLGAKDMGNDLRDRRIAALRGRGNLVLMVLPAP